MEPVFAQHTDCPSLTVTEDGVNAYSVTSTVMAAPLLAHRLVDEELVEVLQATAVRAKKASSTRLIRDRKSTRLNSSHLVISYAVFCLKKKKKSACAWTLRSALRRHSH